MAQIHPPCFSLRSGPPTCTVAGMETPHPTWSSIKDDEKRRRREVVVGVALVFGIGVAVLALAGFFVSWLGLA